MLRITITSILLFSSLLHATTYYVATNGSDSNSGTSSSPFATLTKGASVAKAGDTVLVGNGTYGANGQYTLGDVLSTNGYNAPVQLTSSGTASAPITFQAQNKWGAILDCGLPSGYTGNGVGLKACDVYFNFTGSASYYVISGFVMQNDYWAGAFLNGSNNSHITFNYNHFTNIGNRVYSVPTGTSSYGIVGVYAGTGSSYITWNGNQFDHIGRLPHSGTIINDDYSHDHGLYIYNGPYTITNNVFFSQAAGWNIQTAPGTHDTTIIENTFIGGVNPQKQGCMILWGQITNATIQNNIGSACSGYFSDNYVTAPSNVVFDHDLTNTASMIAISGTTSTNDLFNSNPLFTSGAYTLTSSSPAIGAGASVPSITTDFTGATRRTGAATIGAYEYGGTIPPPPVSPAIPVSLTATAPSSGGINLAWSNPALVGTTILIQQSLDGSTYSQIASIPITTSYTVGGLAVNTTYYFRIQANNTIGSSGYSNVAQTTTSNVIPPSTTITYLPSTLNFGSVASGSSSSISLLTVTNSSTASVTIASTTFSNAQFVFGGTGTCNIGTKLAVGKTCTISVKFTPVSIGAIKATSIVTIGSTTYTSTLTGTGTAATHRKRRKR